MFFFLLGERVMKCGFVFCVVFGFFMGPAWGAGFAVVDDATSSTISLQLAPPAHTDRVQVFVGSSPFSAERLVATLDGFPSSVVVSNLAPDQGVFVRVAAYQGESFLAEEQVHGVTLGGQVWSVDLDSKIRRVHLLAPNIVQVVVAEEWVEMCPEPEVFEHKFPVDPDALQVGVWQVSRHDGVPIPVTQVSRYSCGVGQADLDSPTQGHIHTDHTFSLHLGEGVGASEVLEIVLPDGMRVLFCFDENRSFSPAVRLNQVGYNSAASERWAYVGSWLGATSYCRSNINDYVVLDTAEFPTTADVVRVSDDPFVSPSVVAAGLSLETRVALETDDGTTDVKQIDLSMVPANDAEFRQIRLAGVGLSYPFCVGNSPIYKSFWTTMRGMFLNRWGGLRTSEYTLYDKGFPDHPTVYTVTDPAFQLTDNEGYFALATPTPIANEIPCVGGHHDAGDYDIRQQHHRVSKHLLSAYEANAGALTDDQLQIPESGNGIPDILDEALWSLAFWEQTQREDGGIPMGAQASGHPHLSDWCHDDPMPYWLFEATSVQTASIGQYFAMAARLVRYFDYPRACALQRRAERAWTYANDPANDGGGVAPDGVRMGFAAQMYALTGETIYKNVFESLWGADAQPDMAYSRRDAAYQHPERSDPGMLLAYLQGPNPRSDIVAHLVEDCSWNLNRHIVDQSTNFHYRSSKYGTVGWGSVACTGEKMAIGGAIWTKRLAGSGVTTLSAEETQRIDNLLSLQADFHLGGNPLGIVWTTGLGSYRVQDLLHNDMKSFRREYNMPTIPGFPMFGPVDSWSNMDYYQPAKDSIYPYFDNLPPHICWADYRSNVEGCEFSIHGMQAQMVGLYAAQLPEGLTMPPSWRVGKTNHSATLPRLADQETVSDLRPLSIAWVKPVNASTILVHFTKPVDQQLAETASNYSINGATISSVRLDNNATTAHLSVSTLTDREYTLTPTNISDRSQERGFVSETPFSFHYHANNQPPTVVITVPQENRFIKLPPALWTFYTTDGVSTERVDGLIATRVITLTADVEDDMRTTTPLELKWEQTAGPTISGYEAVIGDTLRATTPVLFKMPGIYTFRLSVFDGEWTESDTITIRVNTPPEQSLVIYDGEPESAPWREGLISQANDEIGGGVHGSIALKNSNNRPKLLRNGIHPTTLFDQYDGVRFDIRSDITSGNPVVFTIDDGGASTSIETICSSTSPEWHTMNILFSDIENSELYDIADGTRMIWETESTVFLDNITLYHAPKEHPTSSPDIFISHEHLCFDEIFEGTTQTSTPITIENRSTTLDLHIGEIQMIGKNPSDFHLPAPDLTGTTLPPGHSISFQIHFSPAQTGDRQATCVIPSNDELYPSKSISLTGNGAPAEETLIIYDGEPESASWREGLTSQASNDTEGGVRGGGALKNEGTRPKILKKGILPNISFEKYAGVRFDIRSASTNGTPTVFTIDDGGRSTSSEILCESPDTEWHSVEILFKNIENSELPDIKTGTRMIWETDNTIFLDNITLYRPLNTQPYTPIPMGMNFDFAEDTVQIVWQGEAGKTYSVQDRTNLLQGDWSNVLHAANLDGITGAMGATNSTARPTVFYRIIENQ